MNEFSATLAAQLAHNLARPAKDHEDGDDLVRLVIGQDSVCVAERVATMLRQVGGADHQQLADRLQQSASRLAGGHDPIAWNEVTGQARESVVSQDSGTLVGDAAALGARLQGLAPFGDWAAKLPRARTLRWGDHLIEDVTRIEVSETGDMCRLRLERKHAESLHQFDRSTQTGQGPLWRVVPRLDINGVAIDVLLDEPALGGHHADRRLQHRPDLAVAAFQPALEFAYTFAPSYLEWVVGVVSAIVPLALPTDRSVSASDARRPGTVAVCAGLDEANTFELLVHEASHQRFFILERICSVKVADDQRLMYSPLPGALRTVDRVVLAYHACVNIAACYETLERNGADVSWAGTDKQRRYRTRIRQMEATLANNPSLTEMGRAFVGHLRDLSVAMSSN